MRHLLAFALVAVAVLVGSSSAHAQAKYGAAGCGLGSIVFGAKPGIIQVLAATTNGTLGSQTFGITSGTSNCADSSGGAASAKVFVETNRQAVAKDISRGSGETIAALASLAGCRDLHAVGSTLQRHFGRIFPDAGVSDAQVGSSVVQVLRAETSLSCVRL
jgi:hypothetical protein